MQTDIDTSVDIRLSQQRGGKLTPPSPDELEFPEQFPSDTARLDPEDLTFLKEAWRVARTRVSEDRDFSKGIWITISEVSDLAGFRYVALNGHCSQYVWAIVVDLDEQSFYQDLAGFPVPPNLVGINVNGADPGHRGRAQLIWLLDRPVRTANPRAFAYLDRIWTTLGKALAGDDNFTRGMSRSPFYAGPNPEYGWYMLHRARHGLHDLADALSTYDSPVPRPGEPFERRSNLAMPTSDDRIGPGRGKPIVGIAASPDPWVRDRRGEIQRNISLFDVGRRHAGKIAKAGRAVQPEDVLAEISPLNESLTGIDHRGPLRLGELASIARSIAKFYNDSDRADRAGCRGGGVLYTPAQRRRGGVTRAAQPGAAVARTTGWKRGHLTQSLHRIERRHLTEQLHRRRSTAEDIAAELGCSMRTVRRYLAEMRAEREAEQAKSSNSVAAQMISSNTKTDTTCSHRSELNPADLPSHCHRVSEHRSDKGEAGLKTARRGEIPRRPLADPATESRRRPLDRYRSTPRRVPDEYRLPDVAIRRLEFRRLYGGALLNLVPHQPVREVQHDGEETR